MKEPEDGPIICFLPSKEQEKLAVFVDGVWHSNIDISTKACEEALYHMGYERGEFEVVSFGGIRYAKLKGVKTPDWLS